MSPTQSRVLAVVFLATGCVTAGCVAHSESHRNATAASDGGSDAGSKGTTGGTPGSSAATTRFDGTTGKSCTSDHDCRGTDANAPGVNRCSSDGLYTEGPWFATPVCIMPGSCDPCGGTSPCDDAVHYCDGPTDDSTSPGICFPTTSPTQAGLGQCLPQCTFKADGSAATGCIGKDVCYAVATDASTTPATGTGYCAPGCTSDADCAGGGQCQRDQGTCVSAVRHPTKYAGTACDTSSNGAYECNCLTGSTTLGYCSTFCTVGGAECPAGWFCEAWEPSTVPNASGASVAAFGSRNVGLAGMCVQGCQPGAASSAPCPPHSSCQSGWAGGPACLPD
jgi:hypothetical protein